MKRKWRQFWSDWLYRRRYKSHCVRDIAKQIEWRLSLSHSAPDQRAAYNLSKKLNEIIR